MADFQVTRLKIKLYVLSQIDGLCPAECPPETELGPVVEVHGNYALNAIPSMSLGIAAGFTLGETAHVSPIHVQYSPLWRAYADRKAVGVYLTDSKDLPGLPQVDEEPGACLFKGYITAISADYNPSNVAYQVTLTHWLVDLTLFPLRNRLSSPENPAALSSNAAFKDVRDNAKETFTTQDGTTTLWSPAEAGREVWSKTEDIGQTLKTLLRHTFNNVDTMTSKDAGWLSKPLLKTVQATLDRVESPEYSGGDGSVKYLKMLELITQSNEGEATKTAVFSTAVSTYINSIVLDSFYGVTAWQKLLAELLPAFYLALVPGVDKCYLIPMPGMQINASEAKDLPLNQITSLHLQQTKNQVLGGVVLMMPPSMTYTTQNALKTGICATQFHCPAQLNPGTLKACYMPGWLSELVARSVDRVPTVAGFFEEDAVTKAAETRAKTAKVSKEINELYTTVCLSFVTSVYMAEVSRDQQVHVSGPLNFNLLPGDVVRIEEPVKLGDAGQTYYGTIQAINYSISPDSAHTNYVINNVRTATLLEAYEKDVKSALLYQNAWRKKEDTEIKLYVKETNDDAGT